MTFTSYGYDGSVNEIVWAKMQPFVGAMYGVLGAGDLRCTPKAGFDRTVTIAAGTAGGHGVMDVETLSTDVVIPSVVSGSRFDMVVLRRDWATNTSSIQLVTGGTQDVTLPTRLNDPGVEDDQPLALVGVTAGSTAITAVRDLRVWPGFGGYYAAHELALQYLARVGSQVRVGNRQYLHRLNALGTAGEWYWTTAQKILGQPTAPAYEEGLLWVETAS